MQKNNKDKKYWIYIRSLDEWVEVPKEVYDDQIKFYNAYRNRMKARNQCCCPKQMWWYCDADCATCKYRAKDKNLSLDQPSENEDEKNSTLSDLLTDKSKPFQDVIIDKMMIDLALQFAHETDPVVEQAILFWKADSSLPVIRIAKLIGVPYMTLCDRLGAYRCKFKNKYS